MASIYDKASLVLIPSGTKTSKVYSQKPVNGDGDFTFSRSTAATRVNADGNIEKETQNLLLQSNSFDTTWLVNGVTITSGQSGYDGTNNAWLLQRDDGFARFLYQLTTTTGVATLSFYVKAGNTDWVYINTINTTAYFDLTNGVVGIVTGGDRIDSQIESVGNGWYRISITANDIDGIRIYPAVGNGAVSGPSGVNIYIQDAQLEQGLVARDYIETTTAAVEGGITDNVPRLDYTDSSCPALLLEPLRTNSFSHSESLSIGVSYKSAGATITMNDAISPEGYQNAAKFTGSQNAVFDTYTGYQPSTTNTFSVFAKAGTCDTIAITHNATGSVADAIVNLTSGTITSTGGTGYLDSSIVDYGNGWYRASITFTSGTNAYITRFQLRETGYAYTYGWQIEHNSSYATSYIPTYGTSVTRNNENTSTPTSSSVADLIGQTEGTAFIDVEYLDGALDDIFILHRSAADGIGVSKNNNSFLVRVYQNGTLTNTAGGTTADSFKLAVTYNSNGVKMFINGALNVSNEFAISFNSLLDDIYLSANPFYISRQKKNIKQFMLFPTALSNEEAIALTTI